MSTSPRTPKQRLSFSLVESPSTDGTGTPLSPYMPRPGLETLHVSPSVDPIRETVDGVSLLAYRLLIADFCNLTATVSPNSLDRFTRLLRKEKIRYRRFSTDHPLYESTVRLNTAEDMRKLMCKIFPPPN